MSDAPLLDWYGVRTVYQWLESGAYEERVTLWKASSFEQAILLAEADAKEYQSGKVKYLGFAQAYDTKMDDIPIESSFEAFSLLRESDLPPADYITKFFDSGREYGQDYSAM